MSSFDSKAAASRLAPVAAACAAGFLAAERTLDAAASKAATLSSAAILRYVDALCAAGVPRTEEGVKVAKAALAAACAARTDSTSGRWTHKTLGDYIAAGAVNAGTIAQYRIRAIKMWYHMGTKQTLALSHAAGEVPVSTLNPLPTPFARGGGKPAAKAAPATSVSRETLDKAIADAIAAARALSLSGFAAEIEKLAAEFLSK